ncbi:MAG: nitroreductase family protein [Catalinimonas sp.]
MPAPPTHPYHPPAFTGDETLARSRAYYELLDRRRSLRDFSGRPVPREVIENLIRAAGTAPSGAHKQPWTFCAVSSPGLKREIRRAAEEEEYASYHGRMSSRWLQDLAPLGTDWQKPFLEIAPWLVVVFRQAYAPGTDGADRQAHYYVTESVGLAVGFFLTAVHHAGLVALTHTPSPMNFLTELLERPAHERPFLLIPVGYPAEGARVPALTRKGLDQTAVWYE